MKNHKLLTLAFCFAASTIFAQTADQYVTAGRAALVAHNMAGAYSNFNAAVTASPTNEPANALLAVTRLLVLPQQPAGSNFLSSLGFSVNGRNIYNWTSSLPVDVNGDAILPSNNSSVAVAYYKTNILLALGASWTNLSRITDPAFTLTLAAAETDSEAVTVDYGDFILMQAELDAAEFLGYTLNAHNCNVVARQLQLLGQTNGLTIQKVLTLYPSLLTQNSAADLASSKVPFTNAIAQYQAASLFIRNSRPPGQGLFLLESNEVAGEAVFRDSLTNVLLSVNGPVQISSNSPVSLDISNYFAGTKTLRSLVPQFNGNQYVNNSLPDYTFGGILLNEPVYLTEAALRNKFPSYAGIYGGYTYDFNYNDPNAGYFAAFVSSNQQVTVVGYDIDSFQNISGGQSGGVAAQFNVDQQGNWLFNSNNVAGVSGSGSLGKHGSFNGELDFTNGDSVQLNGFQPSLQPPLGPFQTTAGNYSGNWSGTFDGTPQAGTLSAVLTADGYIVFCIFNHGAQNDGGLGQFGVDNQFTTASTASGSTVFGTLTNATLKIGGTFSNATGSAKWTLSRSAYVAFDVPPVITTNLPANLTVGLGATTNFFLSVTGSAPLCYQWYFNGSAIPNATTNTLVVSNNLWTSTGDYSISASVNNAVGGTNSLQCTVHVSTEAGSPNIAITAPAPGQLWSNSAFTVTGTASDQVAVTNVYYSLNNAAYAPAATINNWANWSAAVTLVPGTNTISAYAVNAGGNPSAISNATVVYILSAVLSVSTNGLGSLNPNDNGALLQIGKSYAITATAGAGFAFTNWTGGASLPLAVLTNGTTIQFLMVSNLMLQANFVDTNKPVLSITNVTAGMAVSNSAFTVRGTAGDNVAVANVFYSFNNSGWSNALTGNNWTNWSAAVTLLSGTNTIAAYAVDTSGNRSATNTFNFAYVVSATLTVSTNGPGSLSPNYNGAALQIGQSYAITATAGAGFAFTNWTGGTSLPLAVLTNGTTIQFLMVSNLMLQANFVDTNKPVLSITNVTAGMAVSNSAFTVRGTAGDNVAVANVFYSFNNSGWSNALTGNNWTNWSAAVTLLSGTNTIAAYAVDTSGNRSATNTFNFAYVVSATLTVSTNGPGSLSPNYNGAALQIGQSYAITATAGAGFAFTNWTGGASLPLAVLTNGTTIQFLMVSNLMLQANFVDTNKPVLSITNVTAGMAVSNSAFTVRGTAGDNVAVANVFYSFNNSGWSNALTGNNWTNWSAAVTLLSGTNTIAAYAVDTSGNRSATNTFNFAYVVSATLTVSTNGPGSLSPNYNGAALQIGQSYAITATAGAGFAFTNWTGGASLPLAVLTNGTTIQFLMVSNLMLQANFVDTNKPVLSITNVTAGMAVSNSAFTVRGTAGDNVAVANVFYSFNNGAWTPAATANNWANWSAAVTLLSGTNTIAAYAVDTSGNLSTTNTFNFAYVVSATLTVSTNGPGSLSPNYNGAALQIGQSYAITATAGAGFAFTNWTGGTSLPLAVLTNGTTIQFLMVSNLMLQANFVDTNKPVLSITNVTAGMAVSNSAFTVRGTAGDNVAVANVFYSFNNAAYAPATTGNNWTNWSAAVTLLSGTNTIAAYAVDTSGNLSATNTFNFAYVVSATLTVSTNGLGSLNPNYNGAALQIGKSYSITATPGSGFNLTNWKGGTNLPLAVLTNGVTIQFIMVSNLMLQANFVDVTPPILNISSPFNRQLIPNALAVLVGTANDNWQVSSVWCQANGGAWSKATTTNGWANWTATLELAAGNNNINVYAIDSAGNRSATNTLTLTSLYTFELQLGFASNKPLASNGLSYTLQALSGLNGSIQVSTDLLNWSTLTNFVGNNTTISFLDPAATNSNRRFYRAVVP